MQLKDFASFLWHDVKPFFAFRFRPKLPVVFNMILGLLPASSDIWRILEDRHAVSDERVPQPIVNELDDRFALRINMASTAL